MRERNVNRYEAVRVMSGYCPHRMLKMLLEKKGFGDSEDAIERDKKWHVSSDKILGRKRLGEKTKRFRALRFLRYRSDNK